MTLRLDHLVGQTTTEPCSKVTQTLGVGHVTGGVPKVELVTMKVLGVDVEWTKYCSAYGFKTPRRDDNPVNPQNQLFGYREHSVVG
jgi:hypothetical protein